MKNIMKTTFAHGRKLSVPTFSLEWSLIGQIPNSLKAYNGSADTISNVALQTGWYNKWWVNLPTIIYDSLLSLQQSNSFYSLLLLKNYTRKVAENHISSKLDF